MHTLQAIRVYFHPQEIPRMGRWGQQSWAALGNSGLAPVGTGRDTQHFAGAQGLATEQACWCPADGIKVASP